MVLYLAKVISVASVNHQDGNGEKGGIEKTDKGIMNCIRKRLYIRQGPALYF